MYTYEHNTYTLSILSAVTCCPHKPGFTRLSAEWSSCCCHILNFFLSQLSALCCSCPLILHHSNSKRDTARARWGGLATGHTLVLQMKINSKISFRSPEVMFSAYLTVLLHEKMVSLPCGDTEALKRNSHCQRMSVVLWTNFLTAVRTW